MVINGAIARIILRYVVGAAFMGSSAIGEQIALDPDIVEILAVFVGVGIEAAYTLAKRWGWRL